MERIFTIEWHLPRLWFALDFCRIQPINYHCRPKLDRVRRGSSKKILQQKKKPPHFIFHRKPQIFLFLQCRSNNNLFQWLTVISSFETFHPQKIIQRYLTFPNAKQHLLFIYNYVLYINKLFYMRIHKSVGAISSVIL